MIQEQFIKEIEKRIKEDWSMPIYIKSQKIGMSQWALKMNDYIEDEKEEDFECECVEVPCIDHDCPCLRCH